jgi:hypothetical protein
MSSTDAPVVPIKLVKMAAINRNIIFEIAFDSISKKM